MGVSGGEASMANLLFRTAKPPSPCPALQVTATVQRIFSKMYGSLNKENHLNRPQGGHPIIIVILARIGTAPPSAERKAHLELLGFLVLNAPFLAKQSSDCPTAPYLAAVSMNLFFVVEASGVSHSSV